MIPTPPRPSPCPMPRAPELPDADVAPPAPPDAPSKSERKRRSHELQKLGEALCSLSDERLVQVELPEALRDAIVQYRRTRGHEARRRQMQYVGKLMREVDEAPLRAAVDEAALGSARETLLLHEAEHWRDRLLDSDDALTEWLQQHADCDAQRLRSLVRAARREAAQPPESRNPRSARELFRFLRPHLSEG